MFKDHHSIKEVVEKGLCQLLTAAVVEHTKCLV